MDSKTSLGRKGEAIALRVLKENGYRIVDRNVRARFGEIDVVARDGRTLCFIEVKARSGLAFGWPEEGVTSQKQWRLGRLALWYLQSRRLIDVPVRFDVLSILLSSEGNPPMRTRLIKGAFEVM